MFGISKKFKLFNQKFEESFEGIIEAHHFWLGKMSQFVLMKGKLREEFAEQTGELMVTADTVLLHQKVNEKQTKKLLEIIEYWRTFLEKNNLMKYVR